MVASRYDGIEIVFSESDIYYELIVNRALADIESKPLGRRMIKGIAAAKVKLGVEFAVMIKKPEANRQSKWNDTLGIMENFWGNKAVRYNELNAWNGVGTRTAVYWNPNIVDTPDGSRPPFIGLAHELIHAWSNVRGRAYSLTMDEEHATVGLGLKATRRKTNENGIRAEHGVAARTQYSGI